MFFLCRSNFPMFFSNIASFEQHAFCSIFPFLKTLSATCTCYGDVPTARPTNGIQRTPYRQWMAQAQSDHQSGMDIMGVGQYKQWLLLFFHVQGECDVPALTKYDEQEKSGFVCFRTVRAEHRHPCSHLGHWRRKLLVSPWYMHPCERSMATWHCLA